VQKVNNWRQPWPAKSTRPEVGNATDNHPRGRSEHRHDGGLAQDLRGMTSDNRCTIQRRLILPHSASGVLRQGRCLPLRSSAICCIELSDVTPPRSEGRSSASPQRIPLGRLGHERVPQGGSHHAAGYRKK